MPGAGDDGRLIPARPSPWFVRMFTRYAERLFRRSFAAVRVVTDSIARAHGVASVDAPLVVAQNHTAWWDPLLPVLLGPRFLPDRAVRAPMDAAQLEKFRFMRKLGIFGVDPDDAASLEAMGAYVADFFAAEPRPTLWITPQGEFADVRAPMRLRPGAAAVAARAHRDHGEVHALCVAVEYAFRLDRKPEVFVRFEPAASDRPDTAAWHRALTEAMSRNADALAGLVVARDPAPFTALHDREGRINPVYDLMLRLRGRSGRLDSARIHASGAHGSAAS